MRKNAGALIILSFLLSGCVNFGPQYFKMGNEAEINKDWDQAIQHYEKAIAEKPNEYAYKMSLMRVRLSASMSYLRSARNFVAQGRIEEALKDYEKALAYDPQNRSIFEEMRRLTQEAPPVAEPEEEIIEYPVKLKAPPDKIELKFTEASLRSIFQALGKHSGMNIIFDELFKDMPMTIDIAGKQFEKAVAYLCLASKNFYRVIDEQTLVIIPDQPVKRIQYEQHAIKVFYLSNINAQDIFAALQQMLRSQIRAPNIFVDKTLNTVTIRDTPANLMLAAKLIRKWDKPRGEIVVDLEIMEVSRQKLREIGVDLDNAALGLRYAGPGAAEDAGWYKLGELKLGASSSYQVSLPSALIRFLQADSDTKVLAQPRLRGVGDEEMRTLVGQKVPIPQTTFTPIAAGGVSQQPITSFTYQDVGLEITIKPKIHLEKEITLEIEVKITNIAGSGFADIPIISNREIKNVIRLKDGETNLLAGLLRDEERRSLSGIAGLAGIPIIGNLFGSTDKTIDQSDLVLTVTPYIIRSLPRTAEDDKPLWIELEGISSISRGDRSQIDEITRREMEMGEETAVMRTPEAEEDKPQEDLGASEVSLDPANFEVPQGREFRISANVRSQQEIGNMSFSLSFNPQIVKLKDIIEGGFIRMPGAQVPFLKNIAEGSCTIGFSSPQPAQGLKGGGNLAILVFDAVAPGETRIMVTAVSANTPRGQSINFTARESRVVVR
ncbi:MAG: secretin N-terminal domain-containing protein [Candidatus Aminicenantales bacterium]